MPKKKKKIHQKQKTTILQRGRQYIVRHKSVFTFIVGAVISAIITVLVTKVGNLIMPDKPIVVEKNLDPIQVVHTFSPMPDSTWERFMRQSEKLINTQIIPQEVSSIKLEQSDEANVNKVLVSVDYPNAKGYTERSAASYFALEMSPLNGAFVDFAVNFFNEKILDDIYCLSIKICKVQDGKRYLVLDCNYEKHAGKNIIRVRNIFTSNDHFEIEVGFFLKKDTKAQYPDFYREVKQIHPSIKNEIR